MSRDIHSDIAHAERVLLHHAEVSAKETSNVALVQHAQHLITHLQQHAQKSHGVLATAKSEHYQAHLASVAVPASEAVLDASATVLRTVFDSNLLSELCAILHSLYARQACLEATPAASAAPVHPVNHDCMQTAEASNQLSASMNIEGTSRAAAPAKRAQHQQHKVPPHCLAAAPESRQQHADAQERASADLHALRDKVRELEQALATAQAEHMDYDFLQLQLQEFESTNAQQQKELTVLKERYRKQGLLEKELQQRDSRISQLQHTLTAVEEERLLRELLPSPSPTVENSQELHHTRSNEQWLVSSETHTAQTRNSVEVSKLHERAKLQEALQDQLSHQLQQELVTAEAMQHRLEEQQQQNKLLQHHLEKSQLDAETQQRQLELAQLEVEEAHQRAQLQDVLTEQLQSQLQEVTKQRDWYRQQNQQLDEQLTPAAVREGRLPQQPELVNTSPSTAPGSPDSAPVAPPDTVQVCCNALYGSDQATASPDSHELHNGASMTAVSQQHLDDIKENLVPPSEAPAICLWPQFADAGHDMAAAASTSLKHGFDHTEQYASLGQRVRAAHSSPAPLQPLPIEDTHQCTLLPVPSSSWAAQAMSHLLTQQPSQLLSHTASESFTVNQPAADVCLLGSPPRQPHDRQRGFWDMSAVSMSQHKHNARKYLGYVRDRLTLPGADAPLPDPQILTPDPQAGHLLDATQQSGEAVGGALSKDVSSEKAFRQLLESAQQQRALAESVLDPEPFLTKAAGCLEAHQEASQEAVVSSPGLQWDLRHLMQSIASAQQQEQLTLQRVHDAEEHMAQLQTDLQALQQQHCSQVAQMGQERESLLAQIQALEDQSGQLQGQLEMQRQSAHAAEEDARRQHEALEVARVACRQEDEQLHRLQAQTWQAMTDSNALGEQQLGSQHGAPKQGYEAQPEQHHLHAALTRAQGQYEAAVKRIRELEQQQDKAEQQACDTNQALHLKEAQLLAAKQSVRSAVVEYMKSTPASASQVAKYDDLIEEASGELDRVEGQLYSATQQLLDLQGELSQLTREGHAADKTKLRKEEELDRLQAELHSLLAGVTAVRHEQQQQERLLALLDHQHQDSLQAERAVQNDITQLKEQLQALKDAKHCHAEQHREQNHLLIKLKQESDMASSKKKQVAQDLEAADAELTSVSQELHSKQVAAGTMDQKMADSELELDSLKQSVHALHAEQVAAKHAQAQAQSQLDQTQAQLDGALLKLSSQEGLQHQGVSKFEDYSLMAKACMATQTDVHSQEEQVGVAVAGHGREEQGAAISKSFASEHDQECTPQAGLDSSLRTSIESICSNHAASHQLDRGDHCLMLQSRDADSVGPHGISVAVPSQTVLQQNGPLAAADVQDVQQLKMHLKEENKRRQQAEQQLLHIQHGSLPATSPQGSPLLATSGVCSALEHDVCQSAATDQGTQPQQQSLTRLHRRLQRLQDERIQLEGVLAHERSLLAQQRSDNAQLRSRLAAHSAPHAEDAELILSQTGYTNVHMGVTTQQHEEGGRAQARQQHSPSYARDHSHAADPASLHASQQQQCANSSSIIPSGQQLENHLLQLQAELALIESERSALHVNLAAQQAQHDSERAALHAAFAAERQENLHVRQQLDVLSHGRLNDSSWHAHAVQLQAQHADVVLELHAAQEQCKACCTQIRELEASKQGLADEALMGKQQVEYLQRQLEGCQQELNRMQNQEHYSKEEVELSLAAQQHDLLLTQQAFHAKQVQFEDGRQQLLDCQEAQQQLQQQLRASQHDASCLQSSLDVATAAKQEAEALCLQLHEEVGRLQSQVAGMTHSVSLCQSQQLELQSGGSQLESMQLLLTDARQHAADLQADKSHLQHTRDSLQKALAQARQQIAQLQADMEGEEQRATAAGTAQKVLQEKVHALEQAAQKSSDKPAALQQQLKAAQTDLAAAKQALQQLSQKAALASTGSQTVDDCWDRQQLAAEKKLLKAEVASLKRRAAEELAILRVIQKEHAQAPQAAKAAAFYKGALLQLSDTLLDTLKHIRHMRDKLLQSAQSVRKFALSNEMQQCLTLLESVVSTLQHSAHSCLLSSSNGHS